MQGSQGEVLLHLILRRLHSVHASTAKGHHGPDERRRCHRGCSQRWTLAMQRPSKSGPQSQSGSFPEVAQLRALPGLTLCLLRAGSDMLLGVEGIEDNSVFNDML